MKRIKQILAIAGIILLAALYLATLILALTDNSSSMQMFYASIVATVIIPVLLWAYSFIYRLIRKNKPESDKNDSGND